MYRGIVCGTEKSIHNCQIFCLCGNAQGVCAVFGLLLMAAEGEVGSSGSQSLDVGDMWRYGCPKSPDWGSSCSASDISCEGENYVHNNECQAIEVIGQDWSSGIELPHGSGPSPPRNEGRVLVELRVAGLAPFTVFAVPVMLPGRNATATKPFSHRGRAGQFRRGMW